jgi:uncharacterized cupredoxin-like copper-binding protein
LASADLRRDASESLTGQLAAGEYVMSCSLAGHESLGMRATLLVEGL